ESGTTTSTAYTDLDGAAVGPAVTVQSSEFALVAWGVECWNSGTGTSRCTVDVVGDTSIPGTDGRAITTQGGAGNRTQMSHIVYYADLNPGTNSFEMKYRVSSGTGTFALRRILVMPY
ncbi:hypothetical protein, partial [Nocardiopsis dassonvillei]|uniref:hypothetical protein n=1 Tax=Nocardiopsis dassonvillei TaxID=2014 RepID=UPI003627D3A6